MKVNILGDVHWESGLGKVLSELSDTGYRSLFESKDYGSDLALVVIGLICQDAELKLKQRIRYSKKDKAIYIDIMIDLNQMVYSDHVNRKKVVLEKIITEVPPIIRKYKMKDFDIDKFEKDLRNWGNRTLSTFTNA